MNYTDLLPADTSDFRIARKTMVEELLAEGAEEILATAKQLGIITSARRSKNARADIRRLAQAIAALTFPGVAAKRNGVEPCV